MMNTLIKNQEQINFDFIDQNDFDQMSIQEKKWAQKQYRMIYAQQMAKAFSQIEHQKRIKRNLSKVEKQKEKQIQQNTERLMGKMESFEQKRKKRFKQKLQAYKLNEEKWTRKMQSIQSKFKHQTRQAIEKAEKYRMDSQSFWKNKEQQLATSRQKNFQKFSLNKTQQNLRNFDTDLLLSLADSKVKNSNTKKNIKFENIHSINFRSRINSERSRDTLINSRALDIDKQIFNHQEKSEMLQKEKQQLIFQNAMKRLAKIESTRKKAQKLKQSSITPVQIRRPKKKTEQNQNNYQQNMVRDKSRSFNPSGSKDSLIDQTIQSHIKAKKLLQQQQSKERDKVLENNLLKIRKDKILKAIKNKVKDIKKSTIKIESSNF